MRWQALHSGHANYGRRVLELLATYPDREALFSEYPFLKPEDLQQALRYAAATVDDERVSIDRMA